MAVILLVEGKREKRLWMAHFRLLTQGNAKILKSIKRRYLSFVLHLAPYDLSGRIVCPWATEQCIDLCLNDSGRASILTPGEVSNTIIDARLWRTSYFFQDRRGFMRDLVHDVEHAIDYSTKRGFKPCFRLNGTSDLLWERFRVVRAGREYRNMFEAFPR